MGVLLWIKVDLGFCLSLHTKKWVSLGHFHTCILCFVLIYPPYAFSHPPSPPVSGSLSPLQLASSSLPMKHLFYYCHSFFPSNLFSALTVPCLKMRLRKWGALFNCKKEWHPNEMDKSEITMLSEISQVQKHVFLSYDTGQTSHLNIG